MIFDPTDILRCIEEGFDRVDMLIAECSVITFAAVVILMGIVGACALWDGKKR